MALYIASLNSGSNGNCYYIGNRTEAILVDAGISCRETEKRMSKLGLDIKKVKAIFVSHEHADHIKGIPVLARKYGWPVYITPGTLQESRMDLKTARFFSSGETILVGNLKVHAFAKLHDACDPHSFSIDFENIRVGVFTDIGSVCPNIREHFRKCNAAFLEANYDGKLLEAGAYPFFLKKRIRNGYGHLSNHEALALFQSCQHDTMSHLILSHLSANNNCPDLVKSMFEEYANGTHISIAARCSESQVYEIKNKTVVATFVPESRQLQLF